MRKLHANGVKIALVSPLAILLALLSSGSAHAALTLSAHKVNFGTVAEGSTAQDPIAVTWRGRKQVTRKIWISGKGSSAFSADPSGTVTLDPNQPLTITVTFAPPATVAVRGAITDRKRQKSHQSNSPEVFRAVLHVGGKATLLVGQATVQPPPNIDPFTPTGTMSTARQGETATMITTGPLQGFVLITGGMDQKGIPLATAEIYNPISGTFTPAPTEMNAPRAYHTATLITQGTMAGDVLLTGGVSTGGTVLSSAEIFDALTGQFETVGSMANARVYHSATAFQFQSTSTSAAQTYVLVAGGENNEGSVLKAVEVFDPVSRTFRAAGNMTTAREDFTMTNLNPTTTATAYTPAQNIGILMIAGWNGSTALKTDEVYTIGGSTNSTPYNGSAVADTSLPAGVYNHTATLLPGAAGVNGGNTAIFCTNTNSSGTGVNSVLVAGGLDASGNTQSSAYVYTPPATFPPATGNKGSFSSAITMTTDRAYHIAKFDPATVTLGGGSTLTGAVLVAGGVSTTQNTVLNSAELFGFPSCATPPCSCNTGSFQATGGPMNDGRELAAAVLIQNSNSSANDDVLIAGGIDSSLTTLDTAELFAPQ
jgi:hypothetical protein